MADEPLSDSRVVGIAHYLARHPHFEHRDSEWLIRLAEGIAAEIDRMDAESG